MKTSNGSEVVGFSTHDWGAAAEVDVKRTTGLQVVRDSVFAVASPDFNLVGVARLRTRRAPDPPADRPVLKNRR